MKRLLILLFCLLIICCRQKPTESFEMIYHSDITEDLFIGFGGPMVYLNNDMIVGMDNVDPTCFFLFNTDSDQYSICNFGNKGQGPNDFISPFSIQCIDDSIVGCYDYMLRRFSEFSISQNCDQFDMLKTTHFLIDHSFSVIKTAYNKYLGIGPFEDAMFMLYDLDGKKIKTFFEYPYKDMDEKQMYKNRGRAMAYQGRMIAHPDRTKFVYASSYGDIIHFYEIHEDEISLIKKIENSFPEYIVEERNGGISAPIKTNNKNGYICVYATNTYIYLLYSGRTWNEHQEKMFEADILRVYDWSGNLIRNIKLDISCRKFCVNRTDTRMWAISYKPDPEIVWFDLNIQDVVE